LTFSIPFAGDAHGGSALPSRLSGVTKTSRQKRGPNPLRKEGAFADEREEKPSNADFRRADRSSCQGRKRRFSPNVHKIFKDFHQEIMS